MSVYVCTVSDLKCTRFAEEKRLYFKQLLYRITTNLIWIQKHVIRKRNVIYVFI